MIIVRDLDQFPDKLRAGAVAIGNFDGVHRGHARIIQRLIEQARTAGGPSLVFTFQPHPVQLLRPHEAPPPLTWTERKAELIAGLGVDALIAYPTDEALLSLSADDFFDEIIQRRLAARAVVEGPNFYFGHGRTGDVHVLAQLCERDGISLEIVEPVVADNKTVSSSRIRALIGEGDVGTAARLLTQPYRIRGLVTHGAGRGVKLGFPTANVDGIDTILPAAGVYAARAYLNGDLWPAAVNIGPNPTFDEGRMKFEAHLIGFSGAIYGRPIEVDFLARLRDIHTFASVDQLKEQLDRDVARTQEVVAAYTAAGLKCPR